MTKEHIIKFADWLDDIKPGQPGNTENSPSVQFLSMFMTDEEAVYALMTEPYFQTAAEMAAGARRLYGVDLAVSLTGIAGPGGGSAEKPVGLVWFGLASAAGVATEKAVFPGSRAEVRAAAVRHALAMLVAAIPG